MRNRTFSFSGLESAWLRSYKSDDWRSLTKKYSGRRLFSYNFFNLLSGDMSVLGNNNSRWFLENILDYTASKQDKYFIPVLRKIAGDTALDESLRQRSSEILEMPWVGKNSFAEARSPQASEILKLLKINSVESKKLAICMIGKFRLTDMLQEVADCLGVPGLETDSAAVLLAFRDEAGTELQRLYLRSSGNIKTSKAILRLLCKTGIQENIIFIFERLWSNSKEIKEVALECLVDCHFKVPDEEKKRMIKLIHEVAKNLAWIISARFSLRKPGDEFLAEPLNREIIYWKRVLFRLLYITYESGRVDTIRNFPVDSETDFSKFFPELYDLIFNVPKKTIFWFFPRVMSEEQICERFQQLFPGEMPEYKNLVEDLINHDYNQISLWTKACTLRSVAVISDENLGESVAALLFSPEEMLQEEAARLISRSGAGRYQSVAQRIPSSAKIRLDKIVSNETREMELLFEKTNFLSSLFPDIAEDKLLFLAKEMKYLKEPADDFVTDPGGDILWAYRTDSKYPDSVKVILEDKRQLNKIYNPGEGSHLYILSLKAIDEFHYLFPEHSYAVLKYIDDHEE